VGNSEFSTTKIPGFTDEGIARDLYCDAKSQINNLSDSRPAIH